MHILIVVAIALHVLSSIFWAGSTFTLARTGGLLAERLFRPQMGAATVAVITGAVLGHFLHPGAPGSAERILAAGAVCAIIAAGLQGAFTGRALRVTDATRSAAAQRAIALSQRAAAVLLMITAVCMAVAKYV